MEDDNEEEAGLEEEEFEPEEEEESDGLEEEEFEPDEEEDPHEREQREATSAIAEELNRVFTSWSVPPKTLAHYTTVGNAVRIIDHGEVWLFNAYTMNDETEIDHAIGLIKDEVHSSEFVALRELLDQGHRFPGHDRRSVYVFCLSPADDLDRLSMWRAYGDDGDGVAIKIRTGALAESRNNRMQGMVPVLSEVAYSANTKTERVHALLSTFERLSKKYDQFSQEDLLGALTQMLWKIAPTFKHEAFEEEREWRLIVEVRKPILSSMNNSASLVEFLNDRRPYVRFQLGKVPGEGMLGLLDPNTFDGALVGPSRNTRANAATVAAALLKRHWSPKVEVSSIPYRGRA